MKRIITLFLVFIQLLSFCAVAEINEKTVTVTIEKATLGQGYIMKPVNYTFTGELTAAGVLVALFGENKLIYSGEPDDSFYLEYVQDYEMPLAVPDKILEMTGSLGDKKSPDWLGEFDYTSKSGWVYTVNNILLSDAASDTILQDGDVVRWQFTLAGWGKDLGYEIESHTQITAADKSNLLRLMADSSKAYGAAEAVALDLFATEADVRRAEQLFAKDVPGQNADSALPEEPESYPFQEVRGKSAGRSVALHNITENSDAHSGIIFRAAPSLNEKLIVITNAETVQKLGKNNICLLLFLDGRTYSFSYNCIPEQALRHFAQDKYNFNEIKLYVTLDKHGTTECFLAAGGERLNVTAE